MKSRKTLSTALLTPASTCKITSKKAIHSNISFKQLLFCFNVEIDYNHIFIEAYS